MRPGFINLVASLATLILMPFALRVIPDVSPLGVLGLHQQNYGTFGRPASSPPRPPTRAERIQQIKAECVRSFGKTRATSEFTEAVCGCAAPVQVDLSGNASNEAGVKCRQQTLATFSQRPNLNDRFDQVFGQICKGSFLNRDGRINDERAQPACACLSKRVRSNPSRAAAFAFGDGEDKPDGRWTDELVADGDKCAIETDAFKSDGWQVATRDGVRKAVLRMPAHPDIAELQLGCGYDGMYLQLRYWPRSKFIKTLKMEEGDAGPGSGWQLDFNANIANGGQAVRFYRHMLDGVEAMAGENEQGNAEAYTITIPDPNNNGTVDVFAGDFRQVLQPVLSTCLPKPAGSAYREPPGDMAPPTGALPDRWRYVGRAATFMFTEADYSKQAKGSNGEPLLGHLTMVCRNTSPIITMAGGFVGDGSKLPERARFTPLPNGLPINLGLRCADEEGGVACQANPNQAQLDALAAAVAFSVEVNGRKLADIPFGRSPQVRQTLPHCAFPGAAAQQAQLPSSTVSPPQKAPVAIATPPAQPAPIGATPQSEIKTGTRYTLTGSMNLRAFPANDGRRLQELSAGTELTITGKTQDRDGAWWSAVAIRGQEAGHVKDSALARNIRSSALGAPSTTQVATTSRTEISSSKPPPQTCTNDLAKAIADHERTKENFALAYRKSFAESEPTQVRCRFIQTYLNSSQRLISTAAKCPSAAQSSSLISKEKNEVALMIRSGQSIGCNI